MLKTQLYWLRSIGKHQITITGGPNFAYEFSCHASSKFDISDINLSTIKIFYNGAEPIHHESIDHFVNVFNFSGAKHNQFLPCYGLAESTLFVTGKKETEKKIHFNQN